MSQSRPVVLVTIDGMRADAWDAAETPFLDRLASVGWWSKRVSSVMPSVTLPCHMSIFHSVPPERHGITTNTWTPQVRPVPGLFEQLRSAGRRSAMCFNWEQLRDLGRPGSLGLSVYLDNVHDPDGDLGLVEAAGPLLTAGDGYDAIFCYLGVTDVTGHDHGWMSPEYLAAVARADLALARLAEMLEGATWLITADHGGHDRTHGTDSPEDLTVPLVLAGDRVAGTGELPGTPSLLDVAPTVAALLGAEPVPEWQGGDLLAGLESA